MESAWYFNTSVYGKTKTGQHMKFDLFDNVNNELCVNESYNIAFPDRQPIVHKKLPMYIYIVTGTDSILP